MKMFYREKHYILFIFITLLLAADLHAAYYSSLPYKVVQPDKSEISCYLSGDEYFNWIHDRDGFTLIQASDGYYYYAEASAGKLIPGQYRAGKVNPVLAGLTPWLKIPEQDYQAKRNAFQTVSGPVATTPGTGTLHNLVIYIRFSDDNEFTTSRQFYDDLFNQETAASLHSYYSEVSYNQLDISSSGYPACSPSTNLSYRSIHPRSYFEPFNATANPGGYSNDGERINREHTLLKNAVEWISINSPVSSGLNIDQDGDGNVDNISFIIRGNCSAWAQLLWAHNWQLFSFNVMINGKRVWQYTFTPENQSDLKTLCHETFHSLGGPDLYHYSADGVEPVGAWDIMEFGSGHMGAWMKYRYSNHTWISSIPVITNSGTYSLNPLSQGTNNCYRIASPNSTHEFFLLEYRKADGLFEGTLPGSGLLVYRIDSLESGNTLGPPDEVYIYRPNGTRAMNGSPSNAYFTLESGRTSINDATNPGCFLQGGEEGGLQIYNVGTPGATISFSIYINEVPMPTLFGAAASGPREVTLNWQKNQDNNQVMLVYNTSNTFGNPLNGVTYGIGTVLNGGGTVIYSGAAQSFIHKNLNNNTQYYYRIFSFTIGDDYSYAAEANSTTLCGGYNLPFAESFNSGSLPDCWTTQHSDGSRDNWDISSSQVAGGSGSELRSTFQEVSSGITRIVSPMINTSGMATLDLSFRSTLDDWAPGATLRVQSSTDGVNWTNEAWSLSTSSNTMVGPVLVHTSIQHNLNSQHTYLAFTIEGNLYKYDFWYIDDIQLKANTVLPVQITLAANPAEGGQVQGGGTYPFGQLVGISAIPNSGWEFIQWTREGEVISNDAQFEMTAEQGSLTAVFSVTEANVVLESSPVVGGSVSGGGIYAKGSVASIHAIPNPGYVFKGWENHGVIISDQARYDFMVSSGTHLIAEFEAIQIQSYFVSLAASPQIGGITGGGGHFNEGSICTVSANPFAGWIFEAWESNGEIVSYRPVYSFQVGEDQSLTAVFRQEIEILTSVNPPEAGQAYGGGSYFSGDTISCKAQGNLGWKFDKWLLNGAVVSTDSAYSFVATSACNLKAEFISGVGMKEVDPGSFNLYPNPASSYLKVSYSGIEKIKEINIVSVEGDILSTSIPNPDGSVISLDVSSIKPGLYVATLLTGKGELLRHSFIVAGR